MPSTFDVHFQILPAEEQTSTRVFGFGFVSAVGVRGPQKLVNRWLKCLMTPKGSDPFDPDYGTGFPNLIGSNIASVQDVVDAAAIFIQECSQQIRSLDNTALYPPDERLQNASILRVETIGDDGFQIWVGITNVAGQQLPVLLPSTSTRG